MTNVKAVTASGPVLNLSVGPTGYEARITLGDKLVGRVQSFSIGVPRREDGTAVVRGTIEIVVGDASTPDDLSAIAVLRSWSWLKVVVKDLRTRSK